MRRPPRDTGFPPGVPLVLDRSARLLNGGETLVGGDPPRALRLSAAGAAVVTRLCSAGAGASAAERSLARRLTDVGLAHPRPTSDLAGAIGGVTVVMPVRDRPEALDRCLAATTAPPKVTDGRQVRSPVIVVVDDGSRDPAAVAAACRRHGAKLVRLPSPVGPAAARNAALGHIDTPLLAFLDSDCVPRAGWVAALAGHFIDPLVAAVAPRVRGESRFDAGPVSRYAAARSPIDMGAWPARVIPGGRVAYVPTAALLVRTAALGDGFDPRLRHGEDVDLVWRLHDAGWRIRYEPTATVYHSEPTGCRSLAARRFRYGTSAAPLAARHPGRLSPLVISPWPTAAVMLALAHRPRVALAITASQAAVVAHRLHPAGVPPTDAVRWPLRNAICALLTAGHALAMLTPGPLLLAAASRRGRTPATILLATPPLLEWARRRPPVDPIRWTALSLADDAAYGFGVWKGSFLARSLAAVRPRLAVGMTKPRLTD